MWYKIFAVVFLFISYMLYFKAAFFIISQKVSVSFDFELSSELRRLWALENEAQNYIIPRGNFEKYTFEQLILKYIT